MSIVISCKRLSNAKEKKRSKMKIKKENLQR